MNRNNERKFSQIPKMNVSRSKFIRKQNVKFTMNAGKLIPFYVDEVLPGDTFSIDTAGICRMSTPIYPVMDNCYLDVYYFYAPMRILWEHTKEFFGENSANAWVQKTEYTIPQLEMKGDESWGTNKYPMEGSILDYMGVPTKIYQANDTKSHGKINALPCRAYVKIWNEWFRDQNIDNPAINFTDDTTRRIQVKTNTNDQLLETAVTGGDPLWVNKFHDYFTSSLPSPEKGEPTLIPMSGNAVIGYGNAGTKKLYNNEDFSKLNWKSTTLGWKHDVNGISANTTVTKNNGNVASIGTYPTGTGLTEAVSLIADLSTVTGATINNLRQAFAVQQFMEQMPEAAHDTVKSLAIILGSISTIKRYRFRNIWVVSATWLTFHRLSKLVQRMPQAHRAMRPQFR